MIRVSAAATVERRSCSVAFNVDTGFMEDLDRVEIGIVGYTASWATAKANFSLAPITFGESGERFQ